MIHRSGRGTRAPAGGALRHGECDVWTFPVPALHGDTSLLDAAEQDQLERLRVHRARRRFVVSRVAQRLVLSRYLGRAASEVDIVRTCERCGDPTHGRPHVVGGPDYSVSHSGSWVVVAVSGAGRVGVDVEKVRAFADLQRFAAKVLSDAERRVSGVDTQGGGRQSDGRGHRRTSVG
jgi:phosphopantetheinyl transferase